MNLLFTVCARAGSKGFQNKNVRGFLGHPLSYYTMSAVDLFISRHRREYGQIWVAVNTDSRKLFQQIDKLNISYVKVPRKESLATDAAAKIDVIRDTLLFCETEKGVEFDIVIDLDLTSPLRSLSDIENAVDTLKENIACDLVFSVTDSRRNPYFNMVKEEQGFYKRVIASDFTARQQAPDIFDMNASIYAYRSEFLKRKGSPDEGKAKVVKMMDTAVLDIDSEEDFQLMRMIGKHFFNQNDKLKLIKENIKALKL